MNRIEAIAKLVARRELVDCLTLGVKGQCWLWRGGGSTDRYGKVWFNGKAIYTHRLAAFLWKQMPLDSPLLVRHLCVDCKRCFNPEHLIFGTDLENNRDTVADGRHRTSALKNADVSRLIHGVRKGRFKVAEFAAKKGCAYTTALRAYSGKTHSELSGKIHRKLDLKQVPRVELSMMIPQGLPVLPELDPDYLSVVAQYEELPF